MKKYGSAIPTPKLFLPIILFFGLSFSQITVNINSGNPVCPFPQFLPYVNPTDTLKNLATNNPAGVPHAEMEKSIREAYQIMMNRASKPGGGVGDKEYIKYASSPQCSEGDGYGLLGAAAMADKETFDGMWLYIHDFTLNKVKRYSDCKDSSLGYLYSQLPGWSGFGANSAADGDFDVALALLQAYKQWGEFMGIDDGCGNPISYRQAAIDFIKALTDTFTYATSGTGLLSGDVGLDGYVKSGDSWSELTGWAGDTAQSGFPKKAEQPGPSQQYFDYFAPAYFHQFADFLAQEDSATYAWNIYQFRRGEASSDWLMGQLLVNPQYIPFAGQVILSTINVPTFTNLDCSEDMRLGWRTIINRVWNGNPFSTWNPSTHQIRSDAANTFEQDIGKRYARFLWDTRQEPWGNGCITNRIKTFTYWGPSVLWSEWKIDGSNGQFFFLNWIQGTGSPSAVVSQDFNLMAEMYRQCEIEFDVEKPGDGYLTSVPFYYHGWFRLLGMLVLSGNYPAPSAIEPSANLKVYCDVNRTSAYVGDTVIYSISYRNFGSADATGASITDVLPSGMAYVSCTGGGTFNQSNRTVTWNIGTIPGFKTATGVTPTTGEVSLIVTVSDATPRQCANRATITCSKGTGWMSNEYRNAVTAIFERNYVDVINRPGRDISGPTEVLPLHGGRPGVHFSFSMDGKEEASTMLTMRIRMFNDAQEPYIDYGNYRFSYFLYDTVTTCLAGAEGCTDGWSMVPTILEGIEKKSVKFLHEMLVPGEDSHGKWNQRFIVQFSDPTDPVRNEALTTINHHLEEYRGMGQRIHRGGTESLRIVFNINNASWQSVHWNDDWSWDTGTVADDGSPYFPITPDFTDPTPGNPGIPVDRLNPKHCETVETTVDNVLIEEWDGYTWRKVFGNAPQVPVAVVRKTSPVKQQMSFQMVSASAITYTLPAPGYVLLQVIDIKGRVVQTVVNAQRMAGTQTVKFNARRLGSSVYFVRLSSGGAVSQKKIISLK